MKYYFAPMEGITGYIYRSVHHEFFPGMEKYFTPFLSPGAKEGADGPGDSRYFA